jgi:hypothetical protein
MSRDEMVTRAKELFGEGARVFYNDGWIIETQIEERFDPEQYKGRAAYDAYMEPESSYGSVLERWAYKNGHSGESMAELFDSYDEEEERSSRKLIAEIREKLQQGFDFDGAGLGDWRDRVLAHAKEKGW